MKKLRKTFVGLLKGQIEKIKIDPNKRVAMQLEQAKKDLKFLQEERESLAVQQSGNPDFRHSQQQSSLDRKINNKRGQISSLEKRSRLILV